MKGCWRFSKPRLAVMKGCWRRISLHTGSYEGLLEGHLCGLAIHTSNTSAHAARNSSIFPNQAFLKALEDGLGIVNINLTPQELFVIFSTPPRGSKELTPQDLANRIHSSCFGKKISDKTDDNIRELLTTVAEAACTTASSYKQLQAHPWEALAACGLALQKQSTLFPSLAIPPVTDNLGISLVFNGLVDPVTEDESEQFWPHHIIACLLRHTEPKKINDEFLSHEYNGLSQLFGALLSSAKNAPGFLQTTSPQDFSASLVIPSHRLPYGKSVLLDYRQDLLVPRTRQIPPSIFPMSATEIDPILSDRRDLSIERMCSHLATAPPFNSTFKKSMAGAEVERGTTTTVFLALLSGLIESTTTGRVF